MDAGNPQVEGQGQGMSGARAWTVAVVATLGLSVSYIDRQTVSAIAPSVRQALGIDHTHFGWLVSAFSMAYLVFAPLSGVVVDRLGARRGYAAAVLVWSFVAAAHGLATSFAMLFLLRVLLGTAEAPAFPSASQALQRAIPTGKRSLAFGLLFTGSSIGAMIAAKLAVPLDAHYGFRWAFAGSALVGSIWIPIWLFVSRGMGGPAVSGAPRASGAVGTPSTTWPATLLSPPVLRAVIAVFGSAPVMLFVFNFTSQYVVERWHVPKAEVGNLLVPGPLLFDAGAIGFGLVATLRERTWTTLKTHRALVLLSGVLSALLALAAFARGPWEAVMLFGLACAGGGGIYALVTADMMSRVPSDRTSSAGGICAASQSLAHIVFSPLIGFTIDHTHSYSTALLVIGLFALPTAVVFVVWPMAEPAIVR